MESLDKIAMIGSNAGQMAVAEVTSAHIGGGWATLLTIILCIALVILCNRIMNNTIKRADELSRPNIERIKSYIKKNFFGIGD